MCIFYFIAQCRKNWVFKKAFYEFILWKFNIVLLFCSKTSTDADDIGDFVDNDNGPVVDPVSKALMNLLSNLLEDLTVHLKDDKKMIEQCQVNDLKVRAQDQVC